MKPRLHRTQGVQTLPRHQGTHHRYSNSIGLHNTPRTPRHRHHPRPSGLAHTSLPNGATNGATESNGATDGATKSDGATTKPNGATQSDAPPERFGAAQLNGGTAFDVAGNTSVAAPWWAAILGQVSSLTPGHDPRLIPGNNLSGHPGPPFESKPASSFGNNSLALRGPNHPPAESLSGSNPPDVHNQPSKAGPQRTPTVARTGAPASPYAMNTLPPKPHQAWSPSSANSGQLSRSSQSSARRSSALSPKDLEEMQVALQAIKGTFSLSPELMERAQPLFQMTPEARNMAILLLALHNGLNLRSTSIGSITIPDKTASPFGFSNLFKTHLRETIQRVRAATWLRVNETPVSKAIGAIKSASAEFRAAHLPPSGHDGPELKALVTEYVKQEKTALALLIKANNEFIHKEVAAGAKIRLCYLRFMANRNRITQLRIRKKSPAYGVAYSKLILDLDQQLWDGKKTVRNVDNNPAKNQEPPSEEQIMERVASIAENPPPRK
ncbi:hypothetical protein PTTG_29935, partial [Puccinia triticina 1-1 BBBD Race 1]